MVLVASAFRRKCARRRIFRLKPEATAPCFRVALLTSLLALAVLSTGAACRQRPLVAPAAQRQTISRDDDAFLEDLSRRTFMFFWEQADPATGIVRDRSRTDGAAASEQAKEIGSIASVGFGLSGMCIAADRGWLPRAQV